MFLYGSLGEKVYIPVLVYTCSKGLLHSMVLGNGKGNKNKYGDPLCTITGGTSPIKLGQIRKRLQYSFSIIFEFRLMRFYSTVLYTLFDHFDLLHCIALSFYRLVVWDSPNWRIMTKRIFYVLVELQKRGPIWFGPPTHHRVSFRPQYSHGAILWQLPSF